MSRPVADFLQALRRVTRQVRLYPLSHPLTAEAVEAAERAADTLTGSTREVVLSLYEGALYQNANSLPHISLEFNSLLQEMAQRGVESVTVLSPVSGADIFDFAAFIAGDSDDLPAEGTIRLNERMLSYDQLSAAATGGLRGSYVSSLEALRSVTTTLAGDGAFELNSVVNAVENLFDQSLKHAGAALLLSTVKSHDEYTFYHSVNTCILTLALGRYVGLEKAQIIPIGIGALLHDIGKVAVSQMVLQHPGRLDPEMWKEVKLHPQEGAQAIMAAGGDGHEIAASVAFEHHARFDGSGYPNVTRAGRPHMFSRLVSVADTYDAVTTRRSYRRAETPNRALGVLLNGAGSSYDPDFVKLFIRMMGIYPPGSLVVMPGGELAMVTRTDEERAENLSAVIVRDAAGALIEPEPIVLPVDRVVEQVLPQAVGIDPASLLERTGVQAGLNDED